MVSNQHLRLFILCFCLVNTAFIAATEDENNERKPYIVYMGEATENSHVEAAENHHNLLLTVIGDESKAREVKIYSYGKNINGFAARLYPHEAEKLSREDGVVSVFKNTQRQLHTTRSWDFLGFVESKYKRSVALESNIIVGVLDTGIDIDSPSFDDKGVGPPPAKWKGKCVTGNNFTRCNNKVIGAKYFHIDQEGLPDGKGDSPADYDGHGTHTSSTIAGVSPLIRFVFFLFNCYSVSWNRRKTRYALFQIKVCWESGCTDMDMLAAFDEAISDGVDVISISIGGSSLPFFEDPIAIGAFHAMKKGILTMCSAGNNGPGLFTVSNLAPWVMTVAANSLDRKFETVVKLGNGLTASGISLNGFSPSEKMYPLTSGTLASNLSAGGYGEPSTCESGTLGEDKVMGKVVYCEAGREEGGNGQDHVVRSLKGAGVIVQLLEPTDMATSTVIAGSYVFFEDGTKISEYINSTKNPQAVIFKTKTTKMVAPSIASFSARGPQRISPNILKPDISAPGLNILAAYSKLASVTGYSDDNRKTLFTIMSGTSMACPHAAAAAAYVKSFHPDWSPAAIKSALMTTATPMRIKGDEAELSYGSGQINPRRAIHPGLVYDIAEDAYLRFLCKEGYNSTTIGLLIAGKKNNTTKTEYRCENYKRGLGSDGLNYPSMHKQVSSTDTKVSEVFYRSVTNVGYGPSNYVAKVWAPKGLRVEVVPKAMSFERPGEKKNFKVMIDGVWDEIMRGIVSASVEWDDSRGHLVRSPILLFRSGNNYN
ncbi:PREDICTED: subtilisin-like protease SBT4.15 [Camelina sativa]|uniref:Subtilisin-like protease SBT4.15 n=1 Tax=Camelina sativa TaxID=90675 RepID=A0ABM1QCA7_CAMSA|nr:PREDICTED: subtilisin-like protease SBT4.15 [Camelina sativa]